MGTAKKIKSERRREKPYLTQTGGPGKGRVYELSRDTLTIGRSEDCEIVMKSESVSRCHAFFKRDSDDRWTFQDNNSKNGIRVNGRKTMEEVLKEGDVLVVGDFTFRFHAAGEITESEALASEKTSVGLPFRPDLIEQQISAFEAASKNVQQGLKILERHSWIVGLLAGVAIGGGLWWKASRVVARPGAAPVVMPKTKPKPPAEPTATGETVAASEVSKADLEVAPKGPAAKPKSDIRDLKVYLREGRNYLKEGDKESAAIAFRFALVLSPNNKEAIAGLKSAGVKVDVPKAATPVAKEDRRQNTEARNKAKVAELLRGAVDAFGRRNYQEAIDRAEKARKIEIKGQTEYLNEAKQIIDRAKQKQKEDFEPFLEMALQKIQEKDFKAAAGLCEEMLRTDPSYGPARECLAKSLEGIAGGKFR